jgi:Ran GTPase-activating protein (RanGAP) involved in mRNA processing and transport
LTTDADLDWDYDYKLCSAVAEGLVNNTTLETLVLLREEGNHPETPENLFNGRIWKDMLKSNHSLKTLSLVHYPISLKGFECIARGLSCNASLETLELSCTGMGDSSVVALVDGLRINKTLKCLDLSNNNALSQSGRAAIERLMGHNILKELILGDTSASVGASTLARGLSQNNSIEKLDLDGTFVVSESLETFHALCESLRGNTALRYLNVGFNNVHLDNVCVTALRLDLMSLETLELNQNPVTSCGIAALAQSLRGPCTLKELRLRRCQLDDAGLLKLGEALITNEALEVLDVRGNNFTHIGASQFFDLLPQMKGLKSVYGLVTGLLADASTNAVGLALVDGLRENTKLQKIFEDSETATVGSKFAPDVAREIDFYLGLNRHGRRMLRLSGDSEPPSGLWPRVLAKLSSRRDTSLLFYFLQNKPKIVKCKVAETTRKRKASNSAVLK